MMTSDSVVKIAGALLRARPKMGEVLKDKRANVPTKSGGQYSYTYADLGSVLDAVLPALMAEGVILLQGTETNESCWIVVETRLLHAESGEWIASTLSMKPNATDPQSFGSAITYARRYAILPLLGLSAEDDDGKRASQPRSREDDDGNGASNRGEGNGRAQQPPPKPKTIDAQTRAMFNALIAQLPAPEVEACVLKAQQFAGSLPTGKVEDLYEGDEARNAFGLMQKAVKALNGAAK